MDLAEPKPAAQVGSAGPALERGAISLDGPGPVAGSLQREPLFEGVLGILRRGRRGVGAVDRLGRIGIGDRAGQRGQCDQE